MNITTILDRYVDNKERYLKLQLNGKDVLEWNYVLGMVLENGIDGDDYLSLMEYLNKYNALGRNLVYGNDGHGPFYDTEYGDRNIYFKTLPFSTIWGHRDRAISVKYKIDGDIALNQFCSGKWACDAAEICSQLCNYILTCKENNPDWFASIPNNISIESISQIVTCGGYYAWMDNRELQVGICLNYIEVVDEHGIGIRISDNKLVEIDQMHVAYNGFI